MADFEMVDTHPRLEELAEELMGQEVVAVDTEADSFYHYFDKTCLVQIATPKRAYLVDPLALGGPAELSPLGPVFASPKIQILFHAAEYDIFVLRRDCRFEFANIFDTMISAQLLGYKAIGLAAVIDHHFGVKVPKDEQRSDWSRRPLTERQLTYAVGDVIYLARLARKLERELQKKGRMSWAQEEFEALTNRQWPSREFDAEGYLRIKGARKLDPSSLAVLRELYLMRDARAREIDRPPFKVLGNRTLLEISALKPSRENQLGKIVGITDLLIRRMGGNILDAVKKGTEKPHPPVQKSANPPKRRMDRKSERRVTWLKRWRAGRSKDLDLDPGVLCPNASLEAIAWINPTKVGDLEGASELKGWFVREFGEEVVDVLADHEEGGEPTPAQDAADGSDKPSAKASGKASGKSATKGSGRSGGRSASGGSKRKKGARS